MLNHAYAKAPVLLAAADKKARFSAASSRSRHRTRSIDAAGRCAVAGCGVPAWLATLGALRVLWAVCASNCRSPVPTPRRRLSPLHRTFSRNASHAAVSPRRWTTRPCTRPGCMRNGYARSLGRVASRAQAAHAPLLLPPPSFHPQVLPALSPALAYATKLRDAAAKRDLHASFVKARDTYYATVLRAVEALQKAGCVRPSSGKARNASHPSNLLF